jgi:hypothetical protein
MELRPIDQAGSYRVTYPAGHRDVRLCAMIAMTGTSNVALTVLVIALAVAFVLTFTVAAWCCSYSAS